MLANKIRSNSLYSLRMKLNSNSVSTSRMFKLNKFRHISMLDKTSKPRTASKKSTSKTTTFNCKTSLWSSDSPNYQASSTLPRRKMLLDRKLWVVKRSSTCHSQGNLTKVKCSLICNKHLSSNFKNGTTRS